jgi:hypothetical protein
VATYPIHKQNGQVLLVTFVVSKIRINYHVCELI